MKQGWEIKKLGEVCDVVGGSTPKTNVPSYWGGDHYWISPAELDGSKYIYGTSRTITDEGVKSAHLQVLPIGTVLLSSRAPIGKVAITKVPMYCNQGFKNLICKNGILNDYVYWFLISHNEYLNSLGTGATFKEISKKVVEQVAIPVPPITEQEKIVAELDCLSGIIEKKKQQLKELDALAQSIFYEMFGNPLMDGKGWGMKRIADVCVVNPSKKDTSKGLGNKDVVSFLPMEDLPIKACYHQPDKTRLYEEVQSSYTCFANDDVLMAKVTPCFENGKLGIATNLNNGVGYGSSEFIVIRANNVDVIKEYIYFITMDPLFIERACAQLTGTSGLRRVPRQYVENCKITLPPIVLQKQFASKIESIERQKELIQKSIKETETLFNSRMDYYFN